jgi:light-regulated signal transduction histidine kinase (bacteriophytochrome)
MRMKSLIENLLSYSRVEASKPVFEPTDMNSILQEVKNDLSEAIQNTGAVIDHGNLPQLSVVSFQLQQLLTNIISNAIKFRKENTAPEIIIESALIKGKDIPEFSGPPETQFYHLCISDNGIGFEQQYAEKIFDIFQRLHGQSEYEGTGIGLAICKKIVATHNGFITASGELGKGASFNVFLPLREKEKTVSFQKETINTSLMDEAL